MTYENLQTLGKIKEVFSAQHITQATHSELVSPKEVYLTRVVIESRTSTTSTQLYGEFGQNYVGKNIRLVQSYDKPEEGQRRFTQQVFINDILEVDQTVVKRA